MSLLDDVESVPRRTMTLFFVIDTSGSMVGNKIGAVNDAVINVLPIFIFCFCTICTIWLSATTRAGLINAEIAIA